MVLSIYQCQFLRDRTLTGASLVLVGQRRATSQSRRKRVRIIALTPPGASLDIRFLLMVHPQSAIKKPLAPTGTKG